MNADGSDVKQLTHELGYDGGPFWSTTARRLSIAPSIPRRRKQIADYKALYAQGLIRPGNLEIWVMDADGSHKRQVTHNGAANFAPFFLPTASASSSLRTWRTRTAAATSIFT